MIMQLDSAKVLKNFGLRPHLGRRLRGHCFKSACGTKFKPQWVPLKNGDFMQARNGDGEIIGKWVPHEMTVDVVVALKPVDGRRHQFEIHCKPEHEHIAVSWLTSNCMFD